MDELIIDVRLNEYAPRDRNPHVPFAPGEIAASAAACRDEGAAIAHFHARDPQSGAASTDPALYCEIARALRGATDLALLPTLGAGVATDVGVRLAHVVEMGRDPGTRADLAPLDLVTTNLTVYDARERRFRSDDRTYANTVRTLRALSEGVRAAGARPVPVAWNVGSLRLIEPLLETGVLIEPLYVELTLTGGGILDGHPPTRRGLEALVDFLPQEVDLEWAVLCVGDSLLELAEPVLELGGHFALGLGDHPYAELGAPTNADVVRQVVERARACGREPAGPEATRRRLGLQAPPGAAA